MAEYSMIGLIRDLYNLSRVFESPPKSVPDSVFRIFSLVDAFVVVVCIWVLKVKDLSSVTPRNFASFVILILLLLIVSGKGLSGWRLEKITQFVFSDDI